MNLNYDGETLPNLYMLAKNTLLKTDALIRPDVPRKKMTATSQAECPVGSADDLHTV